MNKKIMILMAHVTFSTTLILPTTNQPENAALLEHIYAADKVGELAQFADNKYIELLEKNSEELQKEKYNYKGVLNKTSYMNLAFGTSIGATGLGAIIGATSAITSLRILSVISAAPRISALINRPVNQEGLSKVYDLLTANVLKSITGFMVFNLGLKALSHIECCYKAIQHDREINDCIKKNQSIIAKLKEIKSTV